MSPTPEEFQAAQMAYMQAVTVLINDIVPVLGVVVSALLGYFVGRSPLVVGR